MSYYMVSAADPKYLVVLETDNSTHIQGVRGCRIQWNNLHCFEATIKEIEKKSVFFIWILI